MSVPGWYPDPSGAPGRFRHWDGATWSAQTTDDPNIPPPLGSGAGGPVSVPPQPKRPVWPWIIGAALAVLVLGGAMVGIWRLTAGDTPVETPSDPPVTTPAEEPTPQDPGSSPSAAALSCANSYGAVGDQADEYTSGGLSYTAVDGWGFRFDRTSWSWVDDVAAWGTLVGDDYAAGIVLGALRTENGFHAPDQAAEATVECLSTHGVFNDRDYTWELAEETLTVDGMAAHRLTGPVTPSTLR